MAYENLLFEVKNQIARVTFNRPKVLNALNLKTVEELDHCLEAIERDDSVRVIILTGAGEKAFVAGADINELSTRRPARRVKNPLFGPAHVPPARNNGQAIYRCDQWFRARRRMRTRSRLHDAHREPNAKIGQPEVKLGIVAGIMAVRSGCRGFAAKGIAHELILTGEMISAEEALRIGLVNRVAEPAELLPTAEAIARKIIANAPLAVKYAMEAMEHGMDMTQEEGLFLEATLFGVCCATEDMREGTRAFLEKRPAKFQGR